MSGLSFDILGYVDPKISITFIENGHVAKKEPPRAAQAIGQCHQVQEPAVHYLD